MDALFLLMENAIDVLAHKVDGGPVLIDNVTRYFLVLQLVCKQLAANYHNSNRCGTF